MVLFHAVSKRKLTQEDGAVIDGGVRLLCGRVVDDGGVAARRRDRLEAVALGVHLVTDSRPSGYFESISKPVKECSQLYLSEE